MPQISLGDLAAKVGLEFHGDANLSLRGLAGLDTAEAGDLSFLAVSTYRDQLSTTRASAVLLKQDDVALCPEGCGALIADDPYFQFARIMQLFHPARSDWGVGVHPTATVHPEAKIHADAWIGPGVHVDRGVEIGRGSRVLANCTIYEGVTIGDDCLIHSGSQIREGCRLGDRVLLQNAVVIGSEGFGFAADAEGRPTKIPQAGIVILEDDVEIGSNTCIDRATMGATRIRRGAKLDNLIQIGHNCDIGEYTVMAGKGGLAGSTVIGSRCRLGGAVYSVGHLKVGDGVQLAGNSVVTTDVPDGRIYAGFPARPHREFLLQIAATGRLPEAMKRMRKMQRQLEELQASHDELIKSLNPRDPSQTKDEDHE
jgi:UDP-3-O-[3-hydroxymyristoyl] glucosamine N-acyltransferase